MAFDPLSLATSVLSSGLSFFGKRKQNKEAIRQSQINRDFQERMSSTAYQRSMADMKAAGLNPILAYQKGGASTPGGSLASVQDELGPAVSTAMQSRRLTAEVKNMEAQNKNILETNKNLTEQNKNLRSQRGEIAARTRVHNADALLRTLAASSARAQAAAGKIDEDFYKSKPGQWIRLLERFSKATR